MDTVVLFLVFVGFVTAFYIGYVHGKRGLHVLAYRLAQALSKYQPESERLEISREREAGAQVEGTAISVSSASAATPRQTAATQAQGPSPSSRTTPKPQQGSSGGSKRSKRRKWWLAAVAPVIIFILSYEPIWKPIESFFVRAVSDTELRDDDIELCPSSRTKFMRTAFEIQKDPLGDLMKDTTVILSGVEAQDINLSRYLGGNESSVKAPLFGKRFYVPLQSLPEFGFNVVYDPEVKIAVVRYQDEPACIAFRMGLESKNVWTLWGTSKWKFDLWWGDFLGTHAYFGPLDIKVATAKCYPIEKSKTQPDEMFIPIRVVAGGFNIDPVDHVKFNPEGKKKASTSSVVQFLGDPGLPWKRPGSFNGHAHTHHDVRRLFGLG